MDIPRTYDTVPASFTEGPATHAELQAAGFDGQAELGTAKPGEQPLVEMLVRGTQMVGPRLAAQIFRETAFRVLRDPAGKIVATWDEGRWWTREESDEFTRRIVAELTEGRIVEVDELRHLNDQAALEGHASVYDEGFEDDSGGRYVGLPVVLSDGWQLAVWVPAAAPLEGGRPTVSPERTGHPTALIIAVPAAAWDGLEQVSVEPAEAHEAAKARVWTWLDQLGALDEPWSAPDESE